MSSSIPARESDWRPFTWVPASFLGLALGVVFFYAGLVKHFHPYEFAEAILAYRLLPPSLVGLAAATIPWLELATGFLLALGYLLEVVGCLALGLGFAGGASLLGGIKRRSCLLLLILLSFIFLIILMITMARGLKIDCGCALSSQRQVGPVAALEDILFLALAAWLYWREVRGEEFAGGA
jgi:putative oxidoreductase